MHHLASDTMDESIQQALSRHPCYNEAAHKNFARMHIPVAPRCNIQCNYCNRKYDCSNESRPGVTSEVLTPAQALEKVRAVKSRIPELSVIGIAGPGDPLANEQTFEAIGLISAEFPELTMCVSTNGLALPENAERLYDLGVRFVTVTMNGCDPSVCSEIYDFVSGPDGRLTGEAAAGYLIANQLEGIRRCVELGMAVKVNIVMIPGINDAHIPELVRKVRDLGAYIVNILPLIPVDGTRFSDRRAPTPQERKELMDLCGLDIRMMRHCRQCRADAIGKLGEDRSQEFRGCGCGPAEDDGTDIMMSVKDDSRVAVATSDGVSVDAGFGNTSAFRIYERKDGGFVETAVRSIPGGSSVSGADHKAHLRAVASAVSDCGTVVVMEIGPLAEKMLRAHGIGVVVAQGNVADALGSIDAGPARTDRYCSSIYQSLFIRPPRVNPQCYHGCPTDERDFRRFLQEQGPRVHQIRPAHTRERSDRPFHDRRYAPPRPVSPRAETPRREEARGFPEVRQDRGHRRSGRCQPPHVLRDAGELVPRGLLQGGIHRMEL